MQHYKLTGFIPLNDEIRINKVEASLNEMPLNLDKDELEEFLKEEDEEDDDDRSQRTSSCPSLFSLKTKYCTNDGDNDDDLVNKIDIDFDKGKTNNNVNSNRDDSCGVIKDDDECLTSS